MPFICSNTDTCPAKNDRGHCAGICCECGGHRDFTGRYATYCPECDTCPECRCPDMDGFTHYQGCSEGEEIAEVNEKRV